MYKYSRNAKMAFFDHNSELPCLFVWFCRQPDFEEFIAKKKLEANSKNSDAKQITRHVESLVDEALSFVKEEKMAKAMGL